MQDRFSVQFWLEQMFFLVFWGSVLDGKCKQLDWTEIFAVISCVMVTKVIFDRNCHFQNVYTSMACKAPFAQFLFFNCSFVFPLQSRMQSCRFPYEAVAACYRRFSLHLDNVCFGGNSQLGSFLPSLHNPHVCQFFSVLCNSFFPLLLIRILCCLRCHRPLHHWAFAVSRASQHRFCQV
jgi:hypothetical protein